MIASWSRQLIFVKSRKTGGTSAEIVLSSWCSGSDICTPIHAEDEPLREAWGGQASNYLDESRRRRYYNHMSAVEIRALLPGLWATAHKCTIERHPYEKVVSRAWWQLHKNQGSTTFEEEIDKAIAKGTYLNFGLYSDAGTVIVDEVMEHSRLAERLAELARDLGAPPPPSLPRAKSGHRRTDTSARDLLTAHQKAEILKRARAEFDLMGYCA